MEKLFGFVGLGLLAALMIPAAIIISAVGFIFDVWDNLLGIFKRRNKWKRKSAGE
ncbi:MAG: hypothetical protein J5999_11945 [Oscillospiraceae bacterium]|nr:hypothetical protein [Oscillospiraceae bacterium]